MGKLSINLANHKCDICIGKNILHELKSQVKGENYFFIVDKLLYEKFQNIHLENLLKDIPKKSIYLLESDERNKNISVALNIIEKLSQSKFSRNLIIVGIGGGIIGDICGFVSSIYMRGVDFINVPTTLLSQVDSSIGGKNGLNVLDSKNLIGTFKQPSQVFIDIKFLETLSNRDFVSGIGEVIKYGIVFDYDFLNYVDENLGSVFEFDFEIIEEIIYKSCKFKIDVVEKDEFDLSVRKFLNYGHTIGHALESVTNYNLYTHGEAVIIGMFYEACIAYEWGVLNADYFNYIGSVLKKFKIHIDTNIFNSELFYNSLLKDKKNRNKKISFILPVDHSKVLEYMFFIDELREINYSKYCF